MHAPFHTPPPHTHTHTTTQPVHNYMWRNTTGKVYDRSEYQLGVYHIEWLRALLGTRN